MIRSIVFIGAGNVATHMAMAVKAAGYDVTQIYSRSESSAATLAARIGCRYTTDKSSVDKADLYICSVKDDAIADAVRGINFGDSIVAHTAGSIPISVLEPYASNRAVLYPMQSFSKQKPIDWNLLTIYLETSDSSIEPDLRQLIDNMGSNCTLANSDKRRKLHIAAVLVSNFSNELYAMADRLLSEQGLDFRAMLPLIDETARKVHTMRPKEGQTGPAIRHDHKVQDSHMAMLNGIDRDIYALLSKAIEEEPEIIRK